MQRVFDDASYDFLLPPPLSLQTRGGLTRYVTASLRDAILALYLRPGTLIDKNKVCARLGVSRSPVSEALAYLHHEGLVEILPQRGSLVSRIRLVEVVGYMLIRRALEGEAVALCAAGRDLSLVDTLSGDLKRLRRAFRAKDATQVEAADQMFHQHIVGSLALPRFEAALDSARANLDRACRLASPRTLGAKMVEEHSAIIEAVRNGDPARAAAAMRSHLDRVFVEVLKFAKANAGQFADGAEGIAHHLLLVVPAGHTFGAPAEGLLV